MRSFLERLDRAIDAILRMEKKMGATEKALAGMADQLDKVAAEMAANHPLDAGDLAALKAVSERIQKLDDLTPDA